MSRRALRTLAFDMGPFEFSSHGLKAAVHEELALPEADDEDDGFEGAEVPMAIGEFEGGADLDDQEVKFEVGIPIPDRIRVNDIELTSESPLRALRERLGKVEERQDASRDWLNIKVL